MPGVVQQPGAERCTDDEDEPSPIARAAVLQESGGTRALLIVSMTAWLTGHVIVPRIDGRSVFIIVQSVRTQRRPGQPACWNHQNRNRQENPSPADILHRQ